MSDETEIFERLEAEMSKRLKHYRVRAQTGDGPLSTFEIEGLDAEHAQQKVEEILANQAREAAANEHPGLTDDEGNDLGLTSDIEASRYEYVREHSEKVVSVVEFDPKTGAEKTDSDD